MPTGYFAEVCQRDVRFGWQNGGENWLVWLDDEGERRKNQKKENSEEERRWNTNASTPSWTLQSLRIGGRTCAKSIVFIWDLEDVWLARNVCWKLTEEDWKFDQILISGSLWRMLSGAQSLAARECELPPAVEKNETNRLMALHVIFSHPYSAITICHFSFCAYHILPHFLL